LACCPLYVDVEAVPRAVRRAVGAARHAACARSYIYARPVPTVTGTGVHLEHFECGVTVSTWSTWIAVKLLVSHPSFGFLGELLRDDSQTEEHRRCHNKSRLPSMIFV
jgi:hypothetical protein